MIEKLDLAHLKWDDIKIGGSMGMIPKTELYRGKNR